MPVSSFVDTRAQQAIRDPATHTLNRAAPFGEEFRTTDTTQQPWTFGPVMAAAVALPVLVAWCWNMVRSEANRPLGPAPAPALAMMAATGDKPKAKRATRKTKANADAPPSDEELDTTVTDWKQGIIAAVIKEFGEKETSRVVEAWERMGTGVIHEEQHGDHPRMVQTADFYIEGLTANPVWEEAHNELEWVAQLEDNWVTVRDELKTVVKGEDASDAQWIKAVDYGVDPAYGPDWQTHGLYDMEDTDKELFPETLKLLSAFNAPVREAYFAKMPAHTRIAPHSDMQNFLLTAHLGLAVPEDGCVLGVGDTESVWRNGEVIMFDGTFRNEEVNDSDNARYVLMMKVWHPDLTEVETEAIEYILSAVDEIEAELYSQMPEESPLPIVADAVSCIIAIEGQVWKLPAPRFDCSMLGKNVTLYDVDEKCYMSIEGNGHVVVEDGHSYEPREVRSQYSEGNRDWMGTQSKEMDKWMSFLQEGDQIVSPVEEDVEAEDAVDAVKE